MKKIFSSLAKKIRNLGGETYCNTSLRQNNRNLFFVENSRIRPVRFFIRNVKTKNLASLLFAFLLLFSLSACTSTSEEARIENAVSKLAEVEGVHHVSNEENFSVLDIPQEVHKKNEQEIYSEQKNNSDKDTGQRRDTEHRVSTEEKKLHPVRAEINKTKNGKTFFGFQSDSTIVLEEGDTKKVTITFTPSFEPISSAEVFLKYDPTRIQIQNIEPASGVLPMMPNIDAVEGRVEFVAAISEDMFGERVTLFSFEVNPVLGAKKGETKIEFIPEHLSALLPDVDNTDTAVRQDLPRRILSVQ